MAAITRWLNDYVPSIAEALTADSTAVRDILYRSATYTPEGPSPDSPAVRMLAAARELTYSDITSDNVVRVLAVLVDYGFEKVADGEQETDVD